MANVIAFVVGAAVIFLLWVALFARRPSSERSCDRTKGQ